METGYSTRGADGPPCGGVTVSAGVPLRPQDEPRRDGEGGGESSKLKALGSHRFRSRSPSLFCNPRVREFESARAGVPDLTPGVGSGPRSPWVRNRASRPRRGARGSARVAAILRKPRPPFTSGSGSSDASEIGSPKATLFMTTHLRLVSMASLGRRRTGHFRCSRSALRPASVVR